MNDNNNKETVIDLSQLFGAVRKSIVSIIIWGIAGLLVSLFATFVLMTPKYSSTIDILVNQKADNTQMQYTAQQADLQAINTYKDVLQKSVILAPVVKEVKERDNYQGAVSTLQKSMSGPTGAFQRLWCKGARRLRTTRGALPDHPCRFASQPQMIALRFGQSLNR